MEGIISFVSSRADRMLAIHVPHIPIPSNALRLTSKHKSRSSSGEPYATVVGILCGVVSSVDWTHAVRADGGRREGGWGAHQYQMTSCALLLTTWHALRLHPRLLR
ncbi:hypothetical protein PI125_g6375 [Phytophthora idaei]|nr:hypothetical protein PI125_g6375 [Phytophthora idaei]